MSAPVLARPPAATRLAVVVHPEHRRRSSLARSALTSFEGNTAREYETTGRSQDISSIASFARASGANVVVAAGGDGTVSTVAAALLEIPPETRPDLAILPLGTANNLARSFGLASVRTHAEAAVTRALSAIHDGATVPLDVGDANGATFVGSFALGMDAAILNRRNRLLESSRIGVGGYPLYLASCAIETVAHQPIDATVEIDGVRRTAPLYNFLATCCPIYAGEFRFAGRSGNRPGQLGTYWFESRGHFLTEYPRAWRRHVRCERGEAVTDAPDARWAEHVTLRLATPAGAHPVGEEAPASAEWILAVRPGGVRLRVPQRPQETAPAA